MKRILSRRKCNFARRRKIKPRPPLRERTKRDVKKSDLKHEQKWQGEILAVSEGVTDKVAEINRKADLDDAAGAT